jgi:hypothetical protein
VAQLFSLGALATSLSNTKMKTTLLILTLLAAALGLRADDTVSVDVATTPAFKTFLINYISAINSKDRAKLNECLYAKSVAMMAEDQKLSDYWFGHRFKHSIPAGYKVYATAIPSDKPLPFEKDGVVFPVRPTHQVQISFDLTPESGVSIVLWTVCEKEKWYEVVPSAPKKK